jgi:uncharacterized protein with HEPN domain
MGASLMDILGLVRDEALEKKNVYTSDAKYNQQYVSQVSKTAVTYSMSIIGKCLEI